MKGLSFRAFSISDGAMFFPAGDDDRLLAIHDCEFIGTATFDDVAGRQPAILGEDVPRALVVEQVTFEDPW
jgi:hypothetical protein